MANLFFLSFTQRMFLGPPFGGLVYQYGGYELPFLIAAGIAALDGVVRLVLITDKLPKKGDTNAESPRIAEGIAFCVSGSFAHILIRGRLQCQHA